VRRLHSQVFFLYGVVVGLAIREALVRVGPDLVLFLSPKIQPRHLYLEALRLVVFFLAITTFYIGSHVFFDKVHLVTKQNGTFQNLTTRMIFGLASSIFFSSFSVLLRSTIPCVQERV